MTDMHFRFAGRARAPLRSSPDARFFGLPHKTGLSQEIGRRAACGKECRPLADISLVDRQVVSDFKPGLLVFGPDMRSRNRRSGVVEAVYGDIDLARPLVVFVTDGRTAVVAKAALHSRG